MQRVICPKEEALVQTTLILRNNQFAGRLPDTWSNLTDVSPWLDWMSSMFLVHLRCPRLFKKFVAHGCEIACLASITHSRHEFNFSP